MGERQRVTLRLPLGGGAWASLDALWPMTEAEWQRMMAVLAAMKPGLVREQEVAR